MDIAGAGLWGLVVFPPDGDRPLSSPLLSLGIRSRPSAPSHQQGGGRSEGLHEEFHGESVCLHGHPPLLPVLLWNILGFSSL